MKAYVVTPGFCNARTLNFGWTRFYETHNPNLEIEHWFLDNHYPIRRKSNLEEMHALAEKHGVRWHDSGGDHGLHGSLNRWCQRMSFKDDDIVIGYDADSYAGSAGFDMALATALHFDKSIAIAALWNPAMQMKVDGGQTMTYRHVNQVRVAVHPSVEMFNITGWNMGFVKQAGGFDQQWSHYGGIEVAMMKHWQRQNKCLAYLPDWPELWGMGDENVLIDPEYRAWKSAHLAGFKGGLADYLRAQGRADLLEG